VDDESGWNAILVEGWSRLVRSAVCDRVDDAMSWARGVLAVAVVTPDDAPATAVERVHAVVVEAIRAETGADLDELGSQAAWATYDDVWAELGRRWADGGGLEVVPVSAEAEVLALLAGLPRDAMEHAGAVMEGSRVHLLRTSAGAHLDVEGVFRWLATEEDAASDVRARARRLVAAARRTT
jgi:hypothetical protein